MTHTATTTPAWALMLARSPFFAVECGGMSVRGGGGGDMGGGMGGVCGCYLYAHSSHAGPTIPSPLMHLVALVSVLSKYAAPLSQPGWAVDLEALKQTR